MSCVDVIMEVGVASLEGLVDLVVQLNGCLDQRGDLLLNGRIKALEVLVEISGIHLGEGLGIGESHGEGPEVSLKSRIDLE